MPTSRLAIVGAGGQALVVLDALLALGTSMAEIDVYDQSPSRVGSTVLGIRVQILSEASLSGRPVHVAVGDNRARARLLTELLSQGAEGKTIIHPAAMLSRSAEVGQATFLAAGSVVGPLARIGAGVILNHNAVVDHECDIGQACHVAPGATLAGKVILGEAVLIGAGANVLPGVKIGSGAVVGAGGLIRGDVAEGTVVVGVPARQIRRE